MRKKNITPKVSYLARTPHHESIGHRRRNIGANYALALQHDLARLFSNFIYDFKAANA